MGLLTTYIVSNYSLLIYNWIPKYIIHSVLSSVLMSADTDAVHQIVDSSTVVHNVERNEVICGLSRNYSNLVWVAELALSGFYVLV